MSEFYECPLCNKSIRRRKMQNHVKRHHPKEHRFLLDNRMCPHGTRLGAADYNKLSRKTI